MSELLQHLFQSRSRTAALRLLLQDEWLSLVAWGAPLSVPAARSPLSLEETVVEGLVLARQDASVLRALPVVVVRNEGVLDWAALKERARRRKVGSELGMLLELTADLSGHPALKGQLEGLRDRRRKVARFYPETSSRFEAALARERSPCAARRWGFLMNMTEETFRATLEKHLA